MAVQYPAVLVFTPKSSLQKTTHLKFKTKLIKLRSHMYEYEYEQKQYIGIWQIAHIVYIHTIIKCHTCTGIAVLSRWKLYK